MKHGAKRPNSTRTNVPPKPTEAFISKRVWKDPDSSRMMIERKGRTYVNPENGVRLRGKSALRRAKDQRVELRWQKFFDESVKRGVVRLFTSWRQRDRITRQWRAEK